MLERPLHRFDEAFLDFLQAADVVPGDVGRLHKNLADGRGLNLAQCFQKSFLVTSSFISFSTGISARSKSTSGKSWRKVTMAASRHSAAKSAPTKPWVMSASRARSTPFASGIPRVWM